MSLYHLWEETQRHHLYVHHFVINNSVVSPSRLFLSLNWLNLCHSNCHLAASVPVGLFEMQSLRPFPELTESAFPGSLWMSMNIWTLESENVGLNMVVSGERDLIVHLFHFCRLWGGWLAVHWSGAHDLDLSLLMPAQISATVLIIRSEIKLEKPSSSSTHHPLLTLPRLHNHKWLLQAPRFLLLLNLPLYFLPGPRPWVCPYSMIPTEGCQGQGKSTPWPHSQRTRHQGLSPEVCCTKARGAAWSPGCFCLVRLLDHKAQSCLCFSGPLPWAGPALGTSFSTFHKLLATPCWGFANGRSLSAAPSCFLPAACESSSSREHELMPSTKNDFHQLCAVRLCSGGCRTKGQKGGESWPRWQMESGPGRMSSAFFNMPFPF